jgi:tRNA dimethylallyltransferase
MIEGLVIAIFGPTASGKSAVAERLADLIPAELVSADAMQVYRGLPILTNQPTRPTRLTAIWPLDHEGSVGEYQRLAHATVDEALAAGRTPIITGGTGLYLRAALAELELPPAPRPRARERFERVYDRLGPERAHAALAERDPAAAAAVHPNDRRRVVRALELNEAGASLRPASDRLWSDHTRHPTLIVGLEVSRAELVARIDRRTREMFQREVVAEALAALAGPVSATARQVIGLEEVASLSRADAMAAVALRTRRYAAYQRKWMRRIPRLVRIDGERPPEAPAEDVLTLAHRHEVHPFGAAWGRGRAR